MAKRRTNLHKKPVNSGSTHPQHLNNSNQQRFQALETPLPKRNRGRWNQAECMIFQQKYPIYGNNWHAIALFISTRDHEQVRSHAQKYQTKKGKKMEKMKQETEGLLRIKQFGDKIVTRRRAGILRVEIPKKKCQTEGKKNRLIKKTKKSKRVEEGEDDADHSEKNKKNEEGSKETPIISQIDQEKSDKNEKYDSYYQQLIQMFGVKWLQDQINSIFQAEQGNRCSQVQIPIQGFVFIRNPFQVSNFRQPFPKENEIIQTTEDIGSQIYEE